MNQWINRVQTHQIFKEISAVDELLETSRKAAQSEQLLFDAWERISRLNSFVATYLSQIDPLLLPLSALNNCVQHYSQIRGNLANFGGNPIINYLLEANNQFDAALTYIAAIPQVKEPVLELDLSAARYRENVGDLVTQFRDQVSDCADDLNILEKRLATLSNEVNATKERADNVISQMQQQFSAAQESRQSDALVAETKRSSDFIEEQENRKTSYSLWIEDTQEKWQKSLSDFEEEHTAISNALRGVGDSVVQQLEQQKEYAEKIVGIISTEAVAHGYGKTANEEKDAVKAWRILAVATLVCWIIAGVIFFAFTYDRDLSVSAMIRQFLISTPFVLLSGFAALQVSKHQRSERVNRQQELEIAAIDPYLASFDEETRKEVKKALAEKIFGQRETEVTKADAKQMFETVSDTLKVVKQLKEALKK